MSAILKQQISINIHQHFGHSSFIKLLKGLIGAQLLVITPSTETMHAIQQGGANSMHARPLLAVCGVTEETYSP